MDGLSCETEDNYAKRLISIYIIVVFIFIIVGCANTAEGTSVTEMEIAETDHTETVSGEEPEYITDAAEQEEQAADSPMPQEQTEPEKECI